MIAIHCTKKGHALFHNSKLRSLTLSIYARNKFGHKGENMLEQSTLFASTLFKNLIEYVILLS